MGTDKYPWGDDEPLPANAGNYAGQEVLADGNWLEDDMNTVLKDFDDHFPRTSPVGSFRAN